ncbi:MAG: HAMP domain-containing protein, partial [Rhodospirillales bacterium]|nr:HAMP domain-containing protein [Rhodospirillales bacterium]
RRLADLRRPTPDEMKLYAGHVNEVGDKILLDLTSAQKLLEDASADKRNNVDDRLLLARIVGATQNLRRHVGPFVALGRQVLAEYEAGRWDEGVAMLEKLKPYEDVFGAELAAVRQELVSFSQRSMDEALDHQWLNLRVAIGLFAAAAAVGLVFSIVITRHIIAALRRLIQGTQAIERGDLAADLPVEVDDEIGQLTRAFNRMIEELRAKERIKDTFGRFVDPRVVAQLVEQAGDNPNAAERRSATVFFSDIRGFSGIGEQLTPAAMVNLLNRYFTLCSTAVRENHGIVDKYIGDAVMAFWTQPFSATDQDHATDACRAALAQAEAVTQLQRELPELLGLRRNAPSIAIRMGLATGDVVVGTIGSPIAKSYTVIGDTVNLASRLEGINKLYGTSILISEATEELARAAIETREIDTVIVAGKTEPIRIYELLAVKDRIDERRCTLRDAYADGLGAYRARDWERATEEFEKCLAIEPKDGPARMMAERVKQFAASPPPADWDRAWKVDTK